MRSILLAIQFLTILPVRVGGDISDRDIARCSSAFPVAGALQGLILFAAAAGLSMTFPADIVSAFIITISVLLNGGFHLDGLADTFDAFAVKSTGDGALDRERRLSIMKDSTTGAIGVVAIVTIILMKFVLTKNIISFQSHLSALMVISLTPVFSKWIMAPAMHHGVPARKDGLGKIVIGPGTPNMLISSSILTLTIFGATIVLHAVRHVGLYGWLILCLFPAGYMLSLAAVWLFKRRLGGLTGDTLGALSEIGEILYLTGGYIWLQRYI
ncbi:MAG TPA: adenosylcobinamide-GDP ribazoletransferase [Dissulfurispiraceae bacterium]|nr:adenosylcobinamide-GDP ribazoletransferase [Dissulfurispiraceae bacterium]